MSDETKRETRRESEDDVADRQHEVERVVPVPRRPAVRFWEITLSPELEAALHVTAI